MTVSVGLVSAARQLAQPTPQPWGAESLHGAGAAQSVPGHLFSYPESP